MQPRKRVMDFAYCCVKLAIKWKNGSAGHKKTPDHCRGFFIIDKGSPYFTISANSAPALNLTTFLAGMVITMPL